MHSLSKSSSLAGYRAGFVAGDPGLVAELLAVRKHAGMMVPTPVQAAMVAALDDDAHEQQQRERYARRRAALLPALRSAGFAVDHSEAGLYLWATRGEPCRDSVAWLAARGILVAPGEFYGPGGAQHVRVALTATDERIAAAVHRLTHRLTAELAPGQSLARANRQNASQTFVHARPRVRNVVVTTSADRLVLRRASCTSR